jgi:hypothetical protein
MAPQLVPPLPSALVEESLLEACIKKKKKKKHNFKCQIMILPNALLLIIDFFGLYPREANVNGPIFV